MKYPIAKQIHITTQNIFKPLKRGERNKATMKIVTENISMEVAMYDQLDVFDEDLFLTILSIANPEGKEFEDTKLENKVYRVNDFGYETDEKFKSINIKVSKYQLIKETKGAKPMKNHYAWLEESLKRLSRTSITIKTKHMTGSSNFLSYAFQNGEDGHEIVSITINPIYSSLFLYDAKFLSYNLQNRKKRMSIKNDAGRSLYSYLLKNMKNNEIKTYKIETFIKTIYQTEDVTKDRINSIKKGLDYIGKIDGWDIKLNENKTCTIKRNEIIE